MASFILYVSSMILTLITPSMSQGVLNTILVHQTPMNVTLGQTAINNVVTPLAMTIESIRVSSGGSTLFNISSQLKMILGDSVLPTRLDTVVGTPAMGSFPITQGSSLIPLWIYITVANTTVPIHLDINPATFIQAVTNNLLQTPPQLFGTTGSSGLASILPPFLSPQQPQPQQPTLHEAIGRNSFTGFPLLPNLGNPTRRSSQN
ncbi:hypothetical protein CHUAL_010176 [Chamberlinius hualienensis]